MALAELKHFEYPIPDDVQFHDRNIIGHGSYAIVYEVKIPGGVCAVKKLGKEEDGWEEPEKIRERFLRECKVMSQLRHPNIVQFFGVCKVDKSGIPSLVTEKLMINLFQLLSKFPKPEIPLDLKFSILHDVAGGLLFLHSQTIPIIHRDLTAWNVLLTSSMVAKIADLGMARLIPDKMGQLTKSPGQEHYMPPEAKAGKYSKPIDVFSFGVLMLFTLTQEFPKTDYYTEDGRMAVSAKDQCREASITKLRNEIQGHKELVRATGECLLVDPKKRPGIQHMRSLLEKAKKESLTEEAKMNKLELIQTIKREHDEHKKLTKERDRLKEEEKNLQQEKEVLQQEKVGITREGEELKKERDDSRSAVERLTKKVDDKRKELEEQKAEMKTNEKKMRQQMQQKEQELKQQMLQREQELKQQMRQREQELKQQMQQREQEYQNAIREKEGELQKMKQEKEGVQLKVLEKLKEAVLFVEANGDDEIAPVNSWRWSKIPTFAIAFIVVLSLLLFTQIQLADIKERISFTDKENQCSLYNGSDEIFHWQFKDELELYKDNELYKNSQMELKEKERELESIKAEIEEKLKHCAEKEKGLEIERDEHQMVQKELTIERDDLKEEKKNLQQEKEVLTREGETVKKERDDSRSTVERLTKEVDDKRKELEEQEAEMKKKKEEVKLQMQQKEQELKLQMQQKERKGEELSVCQQNMAELKKELNQSRQDLDNEQKNLEKEREDCRKSKEKCTQHQTKNTQQTKNIKVMIIGSITQPPRSFSNTSSPDAVSQIPPSQLSNEDRQKLTNLGLPQYQWDNHHALLAISEKSETDDVVAINISRPRMELSYTYVLEQIKVFLRDGGAALHYYGNGGKDTGDWCFNDGCITFNNIAELYMEHRHRKRLSIVSDCHSSGQWIAEAAKYLDDQGVKPCGHSARESGFLWKIFASSHAGQDSTELLYTTRAMKLKAGEITYMSNVIIGDAQKTTLVNFMDINCGKGCREKCSNVPKAWLSAVKQRYMCGDGQDCKVNKTKKKERDAEQQPPTKTETNKTKKDIAVMIIGSIALPVERETSDDAFQNVVPQIPPSQLSDEDHRSLTNLGLPQYQWDYLNALMAMYNNAERYEVVSVNISRPGMELSHKDILEHIEVFLQHNHYSVSLRYFGNGGRDTGDWCFNDGCITFNNITELYMKHRHRKRLSIVSDCHSSGQWIAEAAKYLDDQGVKPCGHSAREKGILWQIIASSHAGQGSTELLYTTRAMGIKERRVYHYRGIPISPTQMTTWFNFMDLRCGKEQSQNPKTNWKSAVKRYV